MAVDDSAGEPASRPVRSKRLIALAQLAADAGEALLGRLVRLVDVERAGVGAGRLLLVAQPLVGEGARGPGLKVLWLGRYRFVEIGGRRLEIVGRHVAQAARDVG